MSEKVIFKMKIENRKRESRNMTKTEKYESAKEVFAAIGVDTDAALETLKKVPVSMHCWQGDDVIGFDHDGPLTGGIQTTGDYPGKARTPEELMAEIGRASCRERVLPPV